MRMARTVIALGLVCGLAAEARLASAASQPPPGSSQSIPSGPVILTGQVKLMVRRMSTVLTGLKVQAVPGPDPQYGPYSIPANTSKLITGVPAGSYKAYGGQGYVKPCPEVAFKVAPGKLTTVLYDQAPKGDGASKPCTGRVIGP